MPQLTLFGKALKNDSAIVFKNAKPKYEKFINLYVLTECENTPKEEVTQLIFYIILF